tara:strand:- start:297 stop:614 length:318 start_codon:yes stop_codon:yes gene_type:complete
MKYGLSAQNINAINSIFRQYPAVSEVILYGSRAKGNFRNGSDIDLTMLGNELDLTTQLRIENALDDLLLPYKIDLSVKAHIENPDLIDHIERVGLTFYSKETAGA